jgi:hypothetical protein
MKKALKRHGAPEALTTYGSAAIALRCFDFDRG